MDELAHPVSRAIKAAINVAMRLEAAPTCPLGVSVPPVLFSLPSATFAGASVPDIVQTRTDGHTLLPSEKPGQPPMQHR
jgi:hypothetical protein